MVIRDPEIVSNDVVLLAVNAWTLIPPTFLALMFMTRFVDHVPISTFGAALHEGWPRDFGRGLTIAGVMLLVYGGATTLVGGLNIEVADLETQFWAPWIATLFILAVSAANEELLFRGYGLQVLMLAIGRWPAMLAMSVLFGLGHHFNPNATWLGTLNTFLAGILLCLAYVRTRSLWFPFGIHVGWNLAIGPIFGFAVSGITMPSFWSSRAVGMDWMTGGTYGPEGGVLGTTLMLTGIFAVAMARKVRVSPTMRSLLGQGAGVVYTADLAFTTGSDERERAAPGPFENHPR